MYIKNIFIFYSFAFLFGGCTITVKDTSDHATGSGQSFTCRDTLFHQIYSVKYDWNDHRSRDAEAALADRNGNIEILSGQELWVPDNGHLFYTGKLIKDLDYTPLYPKKIRSVINYQDQFVYLDQKQIFSNAWAGKLQIDHGMPNARYFAGGKDFQFLVSDGQKLAYFNKEGKQLWSGATPKIRQIIYQKTTDCFLLAGLRFVSIFSPKDASVKNIYEGKNITCAEAFGDKIAVGTSNGYLLLPDTTRINKVPYPEITTMSNIDGELWFGSTWGAFKLNKNGRYAYFEGERWLPGNKIISIEKGHQNSILILTAKGLAQLISQPITLEEKALFFEQQVRKKNIRYGFNCAFSNLPNGYSAPQLGSQPSDNLWTGMYLASQLYRYRVTGSKEARQNAMEAFDAMERLHTITGIPGLFARSFERDYLTKNTKEEGWEQKELISGSPAKLWIRGSDHPNWTFRSTASSDQAVGQLFALTTILELADDEAWKQRARTLLDNLMGYIVDHDLYLIDVDGEPTLWGKWNPDYVNKFPPNVGDRRLYSLNIIAFLQTAYHFTGKEKYKDKAYELFEKYGYLDNLMRPVKEIGAAPKDADEWSKRLSAEWNHSDDEMYFLTYQQLFSYAFTPELKEKYRQSIYDHWNSERPEKNALWNFIYATTGDQQFDLEESIRYLQDYPLDLRNWAIHNSQRQDIEVLPENFRGQATRELLPLGEIPLHRHNSDIFKLDSEGDGNTLISAGDVWLLPYWMGRYLGVISAPDSTLKQSGLTAIID